MRRRTLLTDNSGHDFDTRYLTMTMGPYDGTIKFYNSNADASNFSGLEKVAYSLDDGNTWVEMETNYFEEELNVTLSSGYSVLWKGYGTAYGGEDEIPIPHWTFSADSQSQITVEGNIMSLLYWDNFANKTQLPKPPSKLYTFEGLFKDLPIVDASDLTLQATTLAPYCYRNMFQGCTSLTTAPELPATTLATYCYHSMFSGCTNLNYIKCLATNISATDCTTNWVNGVNIYSRTGTFVKAISMEDWTYGNNGIPASHSLYDCSLRTFSVLNEEQYYKLSSEGTEVGRGCYGDTSEFNILDINGNIVTGLTLEVSQEGYFQEKVGIQYSSSTGLITITIPLTQDDSAFWYLSFSFTDSTYGKINLIHKVTSKNCVPC